jgi:hypothetical protein
MCCTQDTGYCYCEDGCINRFGNHSVGSCDLATAPLRCITGSMEVDGCE